MPNVLILPRSADYSEEVWMEIREKAISILQTLFLDGVIPDSAISDEDDEVSQIADEDEKSEKQEKETPLFICDTEPQIDDIQLSPESFKRKGIDQPKDFHSEPQGSGVSQTTATRSEGRSGRSGKKGKKRQARRKSQLKSDELSALEKDRTFTSQREDDTAMSGTDQVLSSSSRFASPEDSRSRKNVSELTPESTSERAMKLNVGLGKKSATVLKEGYVIALHAKERPALHVSRQRVQGGGWFLDTLSNVTKRDPAAQFLVAFRTKDTIGLRSFAAGGKLLQLLIDIAV
ncbi:hypothetical protein GIB67_037178 [Kingdonia uniflora]|uniref:Uncharacterized protein n=1 Tax=Kingdonia uniflora TaxID=39325 RepID=A0A7J7MRR1_9MAGN|nr:hypothetical protein GIB67_037178 [Kingdonia uniflora]